MMNPLKIIFAGTPAFSLPCLKALYEAGHSIIGVFTQPDRPCGRGQKPQASIIKQWAIEHHLDVYQPESLKNPEIHKVIADLKPDVMVVVAYGLILPQTILNIPHYGCVNVHASLLPRWRGAAPIQYAIRSGDKTSGITIMQMDIGMDTGAILKQQPCHIDDNDNAQDLFDKLSHIAPPVLLETLQEIARGESQAIPQSEELVTYSPKISKHEAEINWNLNSEQILLNLRAFYPWPCGFSSYQGKNIKIHAAVLETQCSSSSPPGTIVGHQKDKIIVKTGNGAIGILIWQWPNENQIKVQDWLIHKAHQMPLGSRLA
jgi:methionyl-tRNA formyltransferase